MKKENFIEGITRRIEEKRNIKSGLRNELSNIEHEMGILEAQIRNYTDAADVDTYTGLKNKYEILENKQELTKKNLDAENKAPDDSVITAEYSGFMAEKKRLDEEYGAQMTEIINQLKKVYEESEVKKGSLRALYDGWIQVCNIPVTYCQSYNSLDMSGVSARVKQLLESMLYTNTL